MKNYTENQKYFNDLFKQELENIFYISRDITQKGDKSVQDTIKAFLSGIGTSVVVSRAADAVGAPGPISGICGLAAGGIAATYFYMSADESSVMHKAKNAVLFLSKSNDSKTYDLEFLDKISFRLVSEFRFSIEMLMKGDTGLNLLIKALINRMMTIITTAPHSKLTQLKTDSDKIKFITKNIFKEPADKFEKDTKLIVSGIDKDLGWNLEELLFHSPILAGSKNNDSYYRFYTYLHTGTKSRQIIPGKIDAEASYKYPPRIFDSEKKVELTANYRKEDKYAPLSFVSNLDAFEIDEAPVYRKDISYIELFNHLRQVKTQNKTVEALFEAIKYYNKAVNELIEYVQNSGKNTSNCFYLFIEIEMLRNIHRNVLIPLGGSYGKEIKNNEQYSQLFEQFKCDYDELTKLGGKIMGGKKDTGRQRDEIAFFIKKDSSGYASRRSIKELADKGVKDLLKSKNRAVRFAGRIVWGLSFIGWVADDLVNGSSRADKCLEMNRPKQLDAAKTSTPSGAQSTPSGAQSTPSGAQSTPSGAQSTPSGAQSTPSESQRIKELEDEITNLRARLQTAEKSTPSGAQSTPSESQRIKELEDEITNLQVKLKDLQEDMDELLKTNDDLVIQNTRLMNKNKTLRERIAARREESKSMGRETESNGTIVRRSLASNVHAFLPPQSVSNSQNEVLQESFSPNQR